MNNLTIINFALITIGAIIMLISIFQAKSLFDTLPFIPESHRKQIKISLLFHRGLMVFFFIGYIVVMVAFAISNSLLSETFISVIFLLGSIFVFIGITIQTRLLSEVQQTLRGILPLCASCKKIRNKNCDPKNQDAWRSIETYISERIDVGFSHGICPECAEKLYPEDNPYK